MAHTAIGGGSRYPGSMTATRGQPWAEDEIAGAVDLYFRMLDMELRGEPFSKMASYRSFCERFPQRNVKAIERKCQNVAACLFDFGTPLVSGLAPARNYQAALRDAVHERVATRIDRFEQFAAADATPSGPPSLQAVDRTPDFKSRLTRSNRNDGSVPPPIDFAAREQANRSLGLAGERWAIDFERLRLAQLGREDLAASVRHVSQEVGDGLGYDILSFHHESGEERLIEVKTTRSSIWTPFYLTRNEVAVSEIRRDSFHLYRLHSFGPRTRVYMLAGSMSEQCMLDPTAYLARPLRGAG